MKLNGTYKLEASLAGSTNVFDENGALVASIVKGPLADAMIQAITTGVCANGGTLYGTDGQCLVGTLGQMFSDSEAA